MRKSIASSFCFSCLLVASLMMGTSVVSFADPFPQWSTDADRYELRAFAEFLTNHPWIANKLWEKPSRANDKDFLEDNKELRFWLQDHPRAREEFREDARAFMDRVRDFERYGLYGSDRHRDWIATASLLCLLASSVIIPGWRRTFAGTLRSRTTVITSRTIRSCGSSCATIRRYEKSLG